MRHPRRGRQDHRRELAEQLGRAFGSEAVGLRRACGGGGARQAPPARSTVAALVRGRPHSGWTWSTSAPSPRRCSTTWPPRGKHGCNERHPGHRQHNPRTTNGFKMVLAGKAICGDAIRGLRWRIGGGTMQAAADCGAAIGSCPRYSARIVWRPSAARRCRSWSTRATASRRLSPAIHVRCGCEVIELCIRKSASSQPPTRSEQAGEPGRPDPAA